MKNYLFLSILAILVNVNITFAQKAMNTNASISPANISKNSSIKEGAITKSNSKEEALFLSLGYSKYIDKMAMRLQNAEKLNSDEQLNLADSYLFIGDYVNATEWYEGNVIESSKAAYKLRYAQALQGSGDCDGAKKWYVAYHLMVNPNINISTIAAPCQTSRVEYAFDFDLPFKVHNLREINSEKYDFSPSYYKNGLVFVSNTTEQAVTQNVDVWLGDNFMDLYFTEKQSDNVFSKPVPLSEDLNSKFHEGPLSFTENGKKIFFTRNDYKNGQRKKNKEGLTSLKIYSADLVAGVWTNIVELPFNDDNFIVCHPTVSPDGKTLYFAANFSDSRGGLDIYVSHYKKGTWSKPENLGDKINSVNNENFPFYHPNGTLYFASNRPQGLGGIDIYQSASADIDGQIVWNSAKNLDEPINSSKDDFGFITNLDRTEGYFSSNRSGGLGEDDIYFFKKQEENNDLVEGAFADVNLGNENTNRSADNPNGNNPTNQNNGNNGNNGNGNNNGNNGNNNGFVKQGKICVLDDELNERIKSAQVKIYELHGGSSKKVVDIKVSDNNGSFTFGFKPNRSYIFEIRKEGYRQTVYDLNVENLSANETLDFCIPVQPANCQRVIGYAYEASTEIGLPNTTVTYVNECTGEVNTSKTDAEGRFEICLPCACKHGFRVSKAGYKTRNQQYLPVEDNCDKVSVINFWLYKGQGNYLLENNDVVLRPGAVITLKRIFYDFDKSNIRQDATADLDDLAALMLEYPSIEIELSSHTDSRGENWYNHKLSQRRATAAQKYLVEKGIAPNRIAAVGYGETKLLNKCADSVECSENAHQLNRRTEVKIVRFDQEEVNVDILQNEPNR